MDAYTYEMKMDALTKQHAAQVAAALTQLLEDKERELRDEYEADERGWW